MKICFLIPDILFPPDTGGKQAIYYRILELSKYAKTFAVMINSSNLQDFESSSYFKEFSQKIDTVVLPRISRSIRKGSSINRAVEIGKWLYNAKPRFAQTFESNTLKAKIGDYIKSNNIDTLVLESPYVAELVDIIDMKRNGMQIFYVMHNIEHHFFKEINRRSCLFKNIIKREANRIKKYEIKVMDHSDKIIGISDWDINYLKSHYLIGNAVYCPSLLPEQNIMWKGNGSHYLIFNGSMNFYPNYHGVRWFLENVFSKLVDEFADIKFKITGAANRKIMDEFRSFRGVEFTGYLSNEQMSETLINALCAVGSIFLGSGVKLKLIECLSFGIPVITTSSCARGIPYENEAPFEIADSADMFYQKLSLIIKDVNYRSNLSEKGKMFFRKNYEITSNVNKWLAALSI